MPTDESILRGQFLDFVYGKREGFICLATRTPRKSQDDYFHQEFFKWPEQRATALKFIESNRGKNQYFGVQLYDTPERKKQNCLPTNILWADLDHCNPAIVEPKPQIVIESSPDRFQALWRLNDYLPPAIAEEYSKRIYSRYKDNGVDSKWGLAGVLRLPFTRNVKYTSNPEVSLLRADETLLDPSIFESMLIDELTEQGVENPELPDLVNLPSAESVLYAHRFELAKSGFIPLYENEPEEDWSSSLWRLINLCFEAGMTREEVFVIAASAKCNKYERDKRPITHLWLDVIKADTKSKAFAIINSGSDDAIYFPEIINDDERALIEPTFINEYVKWASIATDAPEQYHELCGSILLSVLLADKLHLPVSWGTIIPNLWGLILGKSSISRKTTAMDLAMGFILETDPELVISAQDSSAEGLLSALSKRPEKVSVYHRDEVAGFFDGMANKSYLAGMPETLTKLYDVPAYMPRQLRKETITVIKPVFVFLGGGIQDRVYETVTEEFFYSGFLPRFLVVSGEADLDNLRWIGPPSHNGVVVPRDAIKKRLEEMVEHYKVQILTTKILGQEAEVSKEVEVNLSQTAWEKMQEIEQKLVYTANESNMSLIALPTFTRLSTSLLKLSMLFAASRQEPINFKIMVELKDILQAADFITKWSPYTIHMMSNVGTTTSERLIQKILKSIREHPGTTRAKIMSSHHLQSMPAKQIFSTLEERGLIRSESVGRGYKLWPV
jgi:ribosomal protein S25